MSRTSKIARSLIFTLIVFSSACVIGPSESNAPRSYFLNPEISWKNPHGYGERIGTAVLLITQPKPQAGFDTARMAYLLRPYEINYFAFNQWADPPARLLHRIMVENLDKTGLWSAVLQTPGTVPAQYRLDSDNLILEQQFLSRPSRVRLALRAQMIDVKKQTILASQYFELFETAASDDAYGGVLAANRAAEKLLVEMAEWLSTVMKDLKQ
jgi:cholesterol transport system auxiliary component